MGHRRTALGLAVAAGLAAVGAVGCGDDGGSEKQKFVSKADAVCTDAARARVDIIARHPNIQTTPEQKQSIGEYDELAKRTDAKLTGVKPPSELRKGYDEYLAARRATNAARQRLLDVAGKGGKAEKAAGVAYDRANARPGPIARRIGLKACAGDLPARDRTQVTATAQKLFTARDPSACTKLTTKVWLEGNFEGDAQKCFEDVSKEPARSATVRDVGGVEGVVAGLFVTLHGGKYDGQTFRLDLVHEGAIWKVAYVEIT